MAIARARTVFDDTINWREFRRAREHATIVWSTIKPKLTLSGEVAPTKRQARFARNILAAGLPSPTRYLEIGSFEGYSIAFVHALLKGQVRATAIDPFENYNELPTVQMSDVESRFRANVKAVNVDARVLQGSSTVHVPRLIEAGERFDLIYIDGSHAALDVITDALLCWHLLDHNGLMIFDDYRMPEVKQAIDAFVRLARPVVVDVASQVFMRRR